MTKMKCNARQSTSLKHNLNLRVAAIRTYEESEADQKVAFAQHYGDFQFAWQEATRYEQRVSHDKGFEHLMSSEVPDHFKF